MKNYAMTTMSAYDPAASVQAATCDCHQLTANIRATLSECASRSRMLAASARQTIATSRGIDWQGNAATLYRERLEEGRAAMEEVSQASQHLLTLIGGTP